MQIIFGLGTDASGALARERAAMCILHLHAELHVRQPRMKLLGVKTHRTALQDGPAWLSEGVLRIAAAPAVEVERRLDFPQAVVQTIKEIGAKTAPFQFALAAARLVTPA